MADVFAEEAAIRRRQALMGQLLQQSQGSQIQGNTGLEQALAKIATAYVTSKNMNRGDQEMAGVEGRKSQMLAGELDNYLKTRSGAPGETMTDQQAGNLMNNDVAPNLAEPVKADPRKAILQAMTSRFPQMQKVGETEFAQLGKAPQRDIKEVNGKLIDMSSGQPVVLGDYSNPQTIGNKAVRWGQDGKPEVAFDGTEKFGPVGRVATGADGKPLMGQASLDSGKVSFAPGGGTTVNVDTGQKGDLAGEKILQEKSIAAMVPGGESHGKATAAADSIKLAQEAIASMANGGDSGALGNVLQTARMVGQRLGIGDAEQTTNTAALSMQMKQRVLAKLGGKLGGQISDGDRQFLSDASGDLTSDPQALKRLMALDVAASIQEISRFNGQIGEKVKRNPNYSDLEQYSVPFNADFGGDDEFGKMVTNALDGKPTVAGKPATPQRRSTDPGQPSKRIDWKDLDPRVKL